MIIDTMKVLSRFLVLTTGAALAVALLSTAARAADAADKDNPTKAFMKKYHKAPQGVDPISKRATMGKATPQELKELSQGYHAMMKAKPPQGDTASWKEKTAKLAAAGDALAMGDPNGAALYKEAINCKACHDAHKPKS